MCSRTLTGIFGALLVASVGCGGSKPVASEGCHTLDELEAALVNACNEADLNAIVKRAYPVGNVLAHDISVYDGVEDLLNWKNKQDMQLRCVRVLDYNDFTLQSWSGEYEGRTIRPNLNPSHWIAVYYWKPPEARDHEGYGPPSFRFVFPVGQEDNKWWCAGVAYTDSKANDSSNEALAPLPAIGEELSQASGISLVRCEGTDEEFAKSQSFVFSTDDQEVMRSATGPNTLRTLVTTLCAEDHKILGSDLLPEGYYLLEVDNVPMDRQLYIDLLCETIASAFKLNIEVGHSDWHGFRITVPTQLPQDIWADADAEWSISGGTPQPGEPVSGYELTGVTFVEFEEWLTERLEAPVTITNPPGGLHSFDILIGGVEVPKLLEVWLKEGGFGLERYQTTVPAITISRLANEIHQND